MNPEKASGINESYEVEERKKGIKDFGQRVLRLLGKKESRVQQALQSREGGEARLDGEESLGWAGIVETATECDEAPELRTREVAEDLIRVPEFSEGDVKQLVDGYNDGDSLVAFVEKAKSYRLEQMKRQAEQAAKQAEQVQPEPEVVEVPEEPQEPQAADFGEIEAGVAGLRIEDTPFVDAMNRSRAEQEHRDAVRELAENELKWRAMSRNSEAVEASREKMLGDAKAKLLKRAGAGAAMLTVAGVIIVGSIIASSLFGRGVEAKEETVPETPEPKVEASTDQEVPELEDEIVVEAESLMDNEMLRSGDLVSDVYEKMDMEALGREVRDRYLDTDGWSLAENGAYENLKSFQGEKSSQFAFGEGMNTDGMTKEEIAELFMTRNVNDPLMLISTVSGFDAVMRGAGIDEKIIEIDGMAEQAEALEGIMNEETQLKMIGALYAALVNKDTDIQNENVTRKAKTYGIVADSETGERSLRVYNVFRNKVKQFFVQLKAGDKFEKVYFNNYCGGQRDELDIAEDDKIDFEVTQEDEEKVEITMKDEQESKESSVKRGGGGTTTKTEESKTEEAPEVPEVPAVETEEILAKNAEGLQQGLEINLGVTGENVSSAPSYAENVVPPVISVSTGEGEYKVGYVSADGTFTEVNTETNKVESVSNEKGEVKVEGDNSIYDPVGVVTEEKPKQQQQQDNNDKNKEQEDEASVNDDAAVDESLQ